MPNYAAATIIGHLGRDPVERKTQSGDTIMSYALAVNTGYGDKKTTTWWGVTVFGKTAATLAGFNLAKGGVIGFVGEPFMREYTDKDGNKRTSLELNARDFILLEGKKDAPAKAAVVSNPAAPFDDEIPF